MLQKMKKTFQNFSVSKSFILFKIPSSEPVVQMSWEENNNKLNFHLKSALRINKKRKQNFKWYRAFSKVFLTINAAAKENERERKKKFSKSNRKKWGNIQSGTKNEGREETVQNLNKILENWFFSKFGKCTIRPNYKQMMLTV